MKRNVVFDILRGIGILCVVFAHVSTNKSITNVIYFFHMPLFFFLTGLTMIYSFREKPIFKDYFLKRVKKIIIPYFVFGFFSFIYWVLIEKNLRGQFDISIMGNFINIFVSKVDINLYAYNVVLWFLPCLFISEILFFFIMKLQNNFLQVFSSIIFLIFGYILCINGIILPFGIETSFIGEFFIMSGYMFMRFLGEKVLVKKNAISNVIIFILSIAGIILCINSHCYVNMLGHTYGNIFLFLVGSFSGILLCMFISILLQKYSIKLFSYLGKNSIIIMCCHEPIKRVILYVSSKLIGINAEILRANILYSLLITVIVVIVLIPIIYIINNYFSFMIGKNKVKSL